MITKTELIFQDTAPFANQYQTSAPRLLFVCSAGLLRSPTAQVVASQMGFNARACGSANYALIPLSVNLINWANKIIFMNEENYHQSLDTFRLVDYHTDIEEKKIVWDIVDDYDWGDLVLFNICRQNLEKFYETS
jgi:predicted protein tyrosine phosphatase